MRLPAFISRLVTRLGASVCALAIMGAVTMPAAQAATAGIVVDADTGAILSATNIDAPQRPDLTGRLLTVIMAIQDVADGTLVADEELPLTSTTTIFAASAIRMTAEGGPVKRVPMTALVSRIGHNPQLLQERMFALARRVGMRGSHLEIRRDEDGGPTYAGGTTVRDSARLMVSLFRAHGDAARTIFERTVQDVPGGEAWMAEGDMCLLARYDEASGRRLVAAIGGTGSEADCKASALLIAEDVSTRLVEIGRAHGSAG